MVNNTFRLFISSTFDDFIDERNILNDSILPKMEEFCQARGYQFQLVDLRWGVNDESVLSQDTLSICLDEVDRCLELSPRPNFLLMVGERYGWVPLPPTFPREDFEALLAVAVSDERALIERWYLFDENEIGGAYYLGPRRGRFVDETVWAGEEARLHDVLLVCASQTQRVSEATRQRLTSSATEQEIVEGLLSRPALQANAIAVFREGYPKRDEDPTKIRNLRQRVTEKMREDGSGDDILVLQWGEGYERRFEERILSLLQTDVEREIERLERDRGMADSRKRLLDQFLPKDVLIDRPVELAALRYYIEGDEAVPLYVRGDSGSGKTTLLAECIHQEKQEAFFGFYGLDEQSYTLVGCLRGLVDEIAACYALPQPVEIDAMNLAEGVAELIALIPESERAVIVIDGLDMFTDIGEVRESLFPASLPGSVRLIVSMAEGEVARQFIAENARQLTIGRFSREESRENLARLLASRHRQVVPALQRDLVERAIGEGTTPLQLRLMAEICAGWRSLDVDVSLPTTVEDAALLYLRNLHERYGHDRETVLYALALIANSPFGVTEDELQRLLLEFPDVRKAFVAQDRYNHDLSKLPFIIWSRLFYDMGESVALTRLNGFIVVKFAHGIFARVFTERHGRHCREADRVLVEHYLSQPSLEEGHVPNGRKALLLPYLLKKTGDLPTLAELYAHVDFVDATVMIGNVDETIAALHLLIGGNTASGDARRLLRLFSCLREHRDMLRCYRDEFVACAVEAGLAEARGLPLRRIGERREREYAFFPYSYNSQVVWSGERPVYAAHYRSHVYVCDGDTGLELCRIYVGAEAGGARALVSEVLWLGGSGLAVALEASETRKVLVYDVAGPVPRLRGSYESSSLNLASLRYSPACERLCVQDGGAIAILDPDGCERVGSVSLDDPSPIGFEVHGDAIYLPVRSREIDVFGIGKGAARSSIRFEEGRVPRARRWALSRPTLHRMTDDLWLDVTDGDDLIALYDVSAGTCRYLHPPFLESVDEALPGRRYLLVVKGNVIVSVDLEDGCRLGYLKLGNVKSASWRRVDEVLSVLTINGMLEIGLDEFQAFPGDSPCLSFDRPMKRTIEQRLGEFYRSHLDTPSVRTRLAILRDRDNLYRYDVAFSNGFGNGTSFLDELTDTRPAIEGPYPASLVIFAGDGKCAVAFEHESSITVHDPDGHAALIIDRLRLAIDDNLLDLRFSPDSTRLLVWCNRHLQVYDVEEGVESLSIDLTRRPALDARFDDGSERLVLRLCDGRRYEISLADPREGLAGLPDGLVDAISFDDHFEYWGPYAVHPVGEGLEAYPLLMADPLRRLDAMSLMKGAQTIAPSQWFFHSGHYHNEGLRLRYDDGEFFSGDERLRVAPHLHKDFHESQLIEQLRDASPYAGYIREKNDLFSRLVELDATHHLLVSRLLNSLILFDASREGPAVVSAAYKVNGNVIGCSAMGEGLVELVVDRDPYRVWFAVDVDAG